MLYAPPAMIFVQLTGGLGNQMFQYAMGRSLALQKKTSLRLDLCRIANGTKRKYGLGVFSIKAEFPPPIVGVLLKLADLPFCGRAALFGMRHALRGEVQYVQDREAGFDNSVGHLSGNLIVRGYWQSEKYFHEHETVIRTDFQFRAPPSFENANLLKRIEDVTAVAVHVRRGDYISNPQSNFVHGTCSLEYYTAAANIMRARLGDPKFFVFSDDPDWAEQHLRLEGPTEIVRINQGGADSEDIRLMAACEHFIIANSSFSWWAAWLGVHPEKVVVAPKRWFANHHMNTCDLLPETWIRM